MKLYKPKELAKEMNVSERYLLNMRKRGEGPAYIRIQNLIRYPAEGVNEFIQSNLRKGA